MLFIVYLLYILEPHAKVFPIATTEAAKAIAQKGKPESAESCESPPPALLRLGHSRRLPLQIHIPL
jgi:hypothetical protein